jgi:glutamine amidotransferase
MITIIDYGMGNLRSVLKAFKRLNANAIISSDPDEIYSANKLVLPGVGHFRNGMNKLIEMDIIKVLESKVLLQKTPILGICLGMQLFSKHSEEGDINGLGWLDSKVIRFDIDGNGKWKIPHMGWNSIKQRKKSSLFLDSFNQLHFYFVHSYHVVCNNKIDILATSEYNIEFVSAIEKGNIFGTQFHPEKSHSAGLKLLSQFINI